MPQGRSLSAVAATLFAATLAIPARTAPPAPPETPAAVHETVLVEGREERLAAGVLGTTDEMRAAPLALSAIGRKELSAIDARTLSDVLVGTAGVNVQPGNAVHDLFVVRGVDSLTGALVTSDGAPEPEAGFYHAYNLERVEVIRGPAGFRWGSGAAAGVVALVGKRPRLGENFVTLGGDYATFDTWRATADAGVASAELGFRVNAMHEESDGFRDGQRSDVSAANPVVRWRRGETSIDAGVELSRDRHHPDAGIPVIGNAVGEVPRTRAYGSPYDSSHQDTKRLRFELGTELGKSARLSLLGYYTSLDWDSDGTLLNGVFPDGTGRSSVSRSLILLDDRQSIVGSRVEIDARLGNRERPRHRLLAGLELQRQRDDFDLEIGLLPGIDLEEPRETATGPIMLLPGFGTAARARAVTLAPYALDRIDLGRGFETWLGARVDHIDYRDPRSAIDRTDTQLSPLLAVTFAAGDRWTLYANAGRGFALPSSRVVGDRRPEESRAFEFGAKTASHDGKLDLQLAAYRLERRNIAIPDDSGVTATTGDQRAHGLELELRARPWPRTSLHLTYALSDAELTAFRELVRIGAGPTDVAVVDRSGNRAPFAPVHLGRLWLSHDLPCALELSGGLRLVGRQNIAPDNVFTSDGYALLDAALAYHHNNLRFALHARNLADATYFGRGFGNASVIPGEGRSLRGSVSWSR